MLERGNSHKTYSNSREAYLARISRNHIFNSYVIYCRIHIQANSDISKTKLSYYICHKINISQLNLVKKPNFRSKDHTNVILNMSRHHIACARATTIITTQVQVRSKLPNLARAIYLKIDTNS